MATRGIAARKAFFSIDLNVKRVFWCLVGYVVVY